MQEKRDYYEVLGVDRSVSDAELKKTYRTLAKKYHPDINPGDQEAEAKFKEISEAYGVLCDPQKRQQYDRFGHAGMNGNGFEGFGNFGFGFDDIFESFFGGSPFGRSTGRQNKGPRRGADLKYTMDIDFNEAAFGTRKEIHISRMQSCSTCDGSGAKAGTSPQTCKHCKGTGQVRQVQSTPFGQMVNMRTCDICRGEGESGAKGGPPGDLYVNVRVKQHPIFVREGYNVICEIPITFTQAALGAELEIPTLDGKMKYDIPEGTQTGTVFRLRNKGIKHLRSNSKGDLYVKVNVEIPTKLSGKQKEILHQFAEVSGDDVFVQRKNFFNQVKDLFQ